MALDSIWLGIAFALGYVFKRINLPPMLGFLLSGFVLNATNAEHSELLEGIADIGVLLLLYTIGLKINIKTLAEKAIFGGTLLSTSISVVVSFGFIWLISLVGLPLFTDLTLAQISIIAFALSFSSTVFVIKILEERGNLNSSEGKAAVGILVIQDILAVLFITIASKKVPSPYALLLLLLPFLRPLLLRILKKSGHGEMLTLFGFLMALVGAELFELVGLKPDLGALIFGIIISNNEKSNELAKNLLHFKDFFLIAFFLGIGFNGIPTIDTVVAAVIISVLLWAKPLIYHFSFTRFSFPSHSSFFASVSLTNYSEFALIVAAFATKAGLITSDWVLVIALIISISFIVSSLLNGRAHLLFEKYKEHINKWGSSKEENEEIIRVDISKREVLIIGMGTVGTNIYDQLNKVYPNKIVGLDSDPKRIHLHEKSVRNVALHDATDIKFWDSIPPNQIHTVVLALPDFQNNIFAIKRLISLDRSIDIYATARYSDEVEMLRDAGAQHVFTLFEEVGKGMANEILRKSNNTLEFEIGAN
ncbi:cation:proton antiporter family protein [Saccharicrinis aurantiacus]|uniref:cation:proton antiporter family protein n=1 Tax=Saccharicrinis aurantiacus TaxID=1849719 RepID=UPI00094F69C3|nr:cation:proton antiporter family protein [Saccharicrinis aurantiacus]